MKNKRGKNLLNELCVIGYLKKYKYGCATDISKKINFHRDTTTKILRRLHKNRIIKLYKKKNKINKYYQLR